MKVTIVGGAGVVGATAAYRIAQDNLVKEIVLFDSRKNQAKAHALDIEQSVVHRSNVKVTAGEIEDTNNSDFIIMCASVPHRTTVTSRSEFLTENLPLVLNLTKTIINQSPTAIWLIVTVPVDAIVHLLKEHFLIPRYKIIGLNRNDTSRFRWAISKVLSVPSTEVEAYVLGEHGDTQVPIFSQIRISGERVKLDSKQIEDIKNMIYSFFSEWNQLQPGRTAGWNSAESIGDILSSFCKVDMKRWVCSVPLEGEYGLYDVSLGVPLKIGKEGVIDIVELELDSREKKALKYSAEALKKQIQYGQQLIKNIKC